MRNYSRTGAVKAIPDLAPADVPRLPKTVAEAKKDGEVLVARSFAQQSVMIGATNRCIKGIRLRNSSIQAMIFRTLLDCCGITDWFPNKKRKLLNGLLCCQPIMALVSVER